MLIDKPETCTCQGSDAHLANMAVAIDHLKLRYFIDPKLGNVFVTAACTTLFYSTTIQRLTWYFYSTTFILVTLQILINDVKYKQPLNQTLVTPESNSGKVIVKCQNKLCNMYFVRYHIISHPPVNIFGRPALNCFIVEITTVSS